MTRRSSSASRTASRVWQSATSIESLLDSERITVDWNQQLNPLSLQLLSLLHHA